MGMNCDQKVDVVVPCDDCDASNGSEIQAAVQAIGAALSGMKINCGGPDNGKPVFGGPGVVATPNPTHVNVTLPVNGALTSCVVNGASIMLNGCDCYTQNLAAQSWDKVQQQFIPFEGDLIATIAMTTAVQEGFYLFQVGETGVPNYIAVTTGSAVEAVSAIHNQLVDLGFVVVLYDPLTLWILADPEGYAVTDIWASGFIIGGAGFGEIGLRPLQNFEGLGSPK